MDTKMTIMAAAVHHMATIRATIANTQPKTKNMSVGQVHSKDSLYLQSNSVI
jgi:hypothetical protein